MAYELLAVIAEFFPDFDRWLRNSSRRSGFMEAAEQALQQAPKEAISEACRRLLHGNAMRAQSLPFAVAEMAKEIHSRKAAAKWTLITGGDTTGCILCHDTGLVEVLHPEVAAQIRQGKSPAFPYSAVVLCTCPAGERRAEISSAIRLPRLDRRVHITLDGQSAGKVVQFMLKQQ